MKKTNQIIIMIFLTAIFISSILLAGSIQFAVVSSIGFLLMWFIAFCPDIIEKFNLCGVKKVIKYMDTAIFRCGVILCIILSKLPLIVDIKMQWNNFYDTNKESSYIYKVLLDLLKNSKWFTGGMENSNIIKILPEYDSTYVLTYYIEKYGKAAGIVIIALLSIMLIEVVIDAIKYKPVGRFWLILISMLLELDGIICILMNFALLPYTRNIVFFPFYTQQMGTLIFAYFMAGTILGIYRYRVCDSKK